MLNLDNITLTHLIAETFCVLGTVVAVFIHGMCSIWYKSLFQPLKCNSLMPHEAPELTKFQAESYVGVRATLPLK